MTHFNLSAFAVRERAITLFLIIAVMAAGVYAFLHLGRAEDPKFTVKTMTVTALWPGATAREMQEQVADRLEKRLQELEYYDRVETVASPGMILMKLYLKDTTAPKDVPEEFYQARKKLGDEKIRLPQGVIGPILNDEFSDVYFSMYSLSAKGLPHRQLVLEAEALRQRFSRIDGVEKVTILGEQDPKIYVEISYKRLATLGVKATDLFRALQTQNDVTPSGFVDTAGPRVYLRLDGALNGVEAVKAIPVASGGKLLKIGDVAEVIRGYEDPASKQIRNQGEPSLVLALVMKKGFNGLTLGNLLKAEETAIRKELPVGLTLSKVSDQSHVISEAIGEFMLKFVVALAVVIVVSLATMGFRVGIVVAAAVPLTLAAVFVIMLITGRDFDRITLGALIISLGLLVDDAIIAIEMMVVKMEQDWDRIEAATFAWISTAGPMLSGTLVTIVGFLPVGFAKSTAGEYAGNIFWVVAFALITSWFVAVIFTPYLGVKLLPNIKPIAGGHEAIYNTPNYRRLRHMVRLVVDHKWIAAGVTVVLFMLSVVGMGFVEKQFFPNSDRPELTVDVNLPPGSAFAATDKTAKNIEKAIMAEPEASLVTSYIGQGMPRFILPTNPELPNPAYAQIVVLTQSSAARDALKKKLRTRVDQGAFPEARVRVKQFVFGPPVPFPVLFRIMGPDPNELRRIAREAKAIMMGNPNVRDVHLDWGELTPSQRLVLDQDRLRLLGLTPQETGLQLQAILNGAPTTQMRDGIRSVDVVVRAPGSERHSLENLANVSLTTRDGRAIPLSQLAHFESRMEDPLLKRYNREPYISVQADAVDGVQPPDVTAQILPKLAKLKASLPVGYRIETGGSVEESKKADTALGKLFPLMVLLMLVIIMIQVRSFAAMFLVFATAPLGLVGAVPTMLLFHQPFGFNAILGLIGLAGIIMRNTLILVDQIKQDQKAGLGDYDAIVESTVRRARPVVLTAVAAMLAFIPLTFSSFWGSMAYVLIGGVGVGTILTLLFLPALYAICFKVKHPQTGAEEGGRACSVEL
ncbi:multidrug transporter [Geomonas limicola]|uniref:Multidrug transporter n=1 Tax=Geomonas limicola TaxID=2740186 RepID=A0A6V8N5W5_9BACT|nr:efflux RND transporter permease subunit [Geomonas limicola]GFO67790.1 multidrug transporter [Geomonas limicola]